MGACLPDARSHVDTAGIDDLRLSLHRPGVAVEGNRQLLPLHARLMRDSDRLASRPAV
jgi:hypothetical protein